jgi:hypothetical protein
VNLTDSMLCWDVCDWGGGKVLIVKTEVIFYASSDYKQMKPNLSAAYKGQIGYISVSGHIYKQSFNLAPYRPLRVGKLY